MNCLQCGAANIAPATLHLSAAIKGETYDVTIAGLRCPACGYETIEGSSMPEFQRLLADEYRRTHGLFTSDQIRAFRHNRNMSQTEFAAFLGVGEASVKRWEMGKIQDARNNAKLAEMCEPRTAPMIQVGVIAGSTTLRAFAPDVWHGPEAVTIDRSHIAYQVIDRERTSVVPAYFAQLMEEYACV